MSSTRLRAATGPQVYSRDRYPGLDADGDQAAQGAPVDL